MAERPREELATFVAMLIPDSFAMALDPEWRRGKPLPIGFDLLHRASEAAARIIRIHAPPKMAQSEGEREAAARAYLKRSRKLRDKFAARLAARAARKSHG